MDRLYRFPCAHTLSRLVYYVVILSHELLPLYRINFDRLLRPPSWEMDQTLSDNKALPDTYRYLTDRICATSAVLRWHHLPPIITSLLSLFWPSNSSYRLRNCTGDLTVQPQQYPTSFFHPLAMGEKYPICAISCCHWLCPVIIYWMNPFLTP